MKDVNLHEIQSPVSPQQRWQWWWDSHQNDAHFVYFLLMSIFLVKSHTNTALKSIMFMQYQNMCKSPVFPQQRRQWWWTLTKMVHILIVGVIPNKFGVIRLWSQLCMFMQYQKYNHLYLLSKGDSVDSYTTFCVLSDNINIVGDIPWRFTISLQYPNNG